MPEDFTPLPFKIQAPTYQTVQDGKLVTKVARERQLNFGGMGTGKTRTWLSYLDATPDTVKFFVIDTDAGWEPARQTEAFGQYAHRVDLTVPTNWLDVAKATVRAMNEMGPRDWWVVDMAENLWISVREYYAMKTNPAMVDDLEAWTDAIISDGLNDDEDTQAMWGRINSLYQPFRDALKFCKGNVYVASTAKEMTRRKDGSYFREGKKTVKLYGGLGEKPGGQKLLGHDLNTVMYANKDGRGKRTFQLVKDREREHKWGEHGVINHNNAAVDLLMTLGGWGPVEEED